MPPAQPVAEPEPPEARTVGLSLALLASLAMLSAAAPLATDLYLPAFPEMVSDLATSATGVQLSLTAFLVGAGLGQLLFGTISDRIGRMRPLIWGTAMYVLASVAAALAPTIGVLVGLRFVQGISGAAGMVISRAIVSDIAHGRAAARAFSLLMLVGGIAPVAAPLAGAVLVTPLGWRGLLWVVAGMGALALVATLLVIRETHPQGARRTERLTLAQLRPLARRRFVGNTLAQSFGFASMMAYISASPFVYQDLMGFSELGYGLAFGATALLMAGVGGLSAKLTNRFSPVRIARTGLLLNLTGIVALAAVALSGLPAVALMLPIAVAVPSLGLVLGPTTALALEEVSGSAGLGSAVMGLLQFGLAGLVAPLVSLGDGVLALVVTMLGASAIANLAFVLAGGGLLRHEPTDPAPGSAFRGGVHPSQNAHQAGSRLPA